MTTTAHAPRRVIRLLAVAVLALALSACSNDDPDLQADDAPGAGEAPASGADLDTVQEGKLTACVDVPYPPFEFEENGKFDGIDPELVRALAGRLSLVADFRDVEFSGIFAALNAGQCDIVASSVSITPERQESLLFTEGYFEINQSLLVRKADDAKYKDLASLKGRTVGVQTNTTGADFAKANAQGATVREFDGADDLFLALTSAQVDAALQDLPVNAYHAKTTGQTVVTKVFTEAKKEEYGIAMPKNRQDLKRALDAALTQIKSDDTYPTILRRFLGDTAGQV